MSFPDLSIIQDDYKPDEKVVQDINFDEASIAWRQNKIKKGESFAYCCGVIKKNGLPCRSPPRIWKQTSKKIGRKNREWGLCTKHFFEKMKEMRKMKKRKEC